MQLFYLFSFAVVASCTAALPQPAELSKRYSDNVDVNLASILEARSYQPEFNLQDELPTLTLIKRQDDPDVSKPPPSPSSTAMPEDSGSNLSPREKLEAASLKLISDIDNVGSGIADLPEYMERIGDTIGGQAGNLTLEYLRISLTVNELLDFWLGGPGKNVIGFIKNGLGEKEYSKIGPDLIKKVSETKAAIRRGLRSAMEAILRLSHKTGPVIQNVETMHKSSRDAFDGYAELFLLLRAPMDKFPDGEKLFGYFENIRTSINKFSEKQKNRFDIIMSYLLTAPSN
ncbi:hypothetical protein BASA50_004274 [Batrachochytrium salamandrivorans]|uniref:Uncharacterized protein n=1 Tax=Batrachochytrium salamandrivorans TaxID=1357716 RepID=A0ABQ8FIV0_9FUNG|nr:hypothetical protein BASA61_009616 [Batrachochytrium salamandrivorans]KAH6581388.1 hypothetical protein BASA60_002444 [Batrachochytrium salamandrivorans]KAH6584784.1 hypothetical protein BASA61_007277 [Batrachochytrium salamandrivorans]KAH6597668.1 hypothetical protein BASA50_004274 [Batrachochytrium salamandrivorans]KAH9244292.1 hypothetical protein BASA81_018314 [Batrachochytrium salamandrivorans]